MSVNVVWNLYPLLQEVEVYVKSTQTDMVTMENQRNEDNDEDELEVEMVSQKAAPAVSQSEVVYLSIL